MIFARGTAEPPASAGWAGLVDAVRSQPATGPSGVSGQLPAASNFDDPWRSLDRRRRGQGRRWHVQSTATNCPKTRIVLGGYSQGAAVAGYVTSASVPPGVPAALVPAPLPTEVANHVAAVTLFGKPSDAWVTQYGAPPIVIGPAYAQKTI